MSKNKRLTDTDMWEQDWFIELPMKYKLFWQFVKDKCDNVGIWRPNKSLFERIIGESIDVKQFLRLVNTEEKHRIVVLPSGRWFLREFFFFQYGETFSLASPVHRGALKQLIANGLSVHDLAKVNTSQLQHLNNEQVREIAYSKDMNTIRQAYQKDSNSGKDKDIDNNRAKVFTGSKSSFVENSATDGATHTHTHTHANKQKSESPPPPANHPPPPTDQDQKAQNGSVSGSGALSGSQNPIALSYAVLGSDELKTFKNRLLSDLTFLEAMKDAKGLTAEALEKWLNQFHMHISGEGKLQKDYPDYKTHFKRWIDKKPAEELRNPPWKISRKENPLSAGDMDWSQQTDH